MIKATTEILNEFNNVFEKRINDIRTAETKVAVKGTKYFVSNSGDDQNDGLTPETAWQSLNRVTNADLKSGDGVFFKRGDLFRGNFKTHDGVTYSAYGEGAKPEFRAGEKPLGDPALWEIYDAEHNIWKLKDKILDVGTLVFNEGEYHSRKLIPTYKNLQFVCRDNEDKVFDMRVEMTRDLDIFWDYDLTLTRIPSRGENFPIPSLDEKSYGELYLRCDKGNPAEVFYDIEALARLHLIESYCSTDVVIDNLCIKYVGMHGIASGGMVHNLTVTNCEFGWIGGCIQTYLGTDPNYPQGGRGSVTRFGNAIEIYGACDGYYVENNYIYEVYDAGITHQITTPIKLALKNITYANNILEKCVYGIEYFLDQIEGERESIMENVFMNDNFIRLSGYGWGQQRHNVDTPALIKGWSYVNTAKNFKIENNIFDRSAYRMLHLVAEKQEYCPLMSGNTYIQNLDAPLGQYGGKENGEPAVITFDKNAENSIKTIFCEENAKVYCIE